MADLYPTYDESTASRIVRWHPSRLHAELAVFDPPASFAGTPRPVYVFEKGGARQGRRSFSIGSSETSPGVHSIPGMMTEELGAYVVVVSTPPGGLDFEAAEEPGQEYAPECRLSSALAKMFLRANAENPDVVGATHTLSRLRRHWISAGVSAGVWSQLGSEMIPAGDLADLADAEAARGNGRYRYDHDHTSGFFFGSIGQNRLSSFCEYVVDPALAGGPSTYVTAGAHAVDDAALSIAGDTAFLRRANRIVVTTTSGYTANGNQTTGTTGLVVHGDTPAIPQGVMVQLVADVGGVPTDFQFLVGADYPGGAGVIDARNWTGGGPGDIADGEPLRMTLEFAVTHDYAGGAGAVDIWPAVGFPIASGSEVELRYPVGYAYGEHSWAVGYMGTASMGRVWRSDDASGRGVPLGAKRDADVDRFVRPNNPRVYELNIQINGAESDSLHRVDSLVHPRSFWVRRQTQHPAPLPEYIDLHDPGDMIHLLHQLHVLRVAAGRNLNGLSAYLGNRKSNPTGVGVVPADQPYLHGRHIAHDAQVLKAWLQDPDRFGGAFA